MVFGGSSNPEVHALQFGNICGMICLMIFFLPFFSSYLDVGSLDLISHFLTSSLIFYISQCFKVYILGYFLLLQLSRLLVNGFSFLLFNFQELLCVCP